MITHAFYRGNFGHKAAVLFQQETNCNITDLNNFQEQDNFNERIYTHAVIFLSDISPHGLQDIALSFREKGISWTSVYISPTTLRIGPLIKSEGVCFECSSNRHKSFPGMSSNTNIEHFIDKSRKMNINFETVGFLPSLIDMAVSESSRQLNNAKLESGFIRKIDLLNFQVSSSIAAPVHGCSCCKLVSQKKPGERFYLKLKAETNFLFREQL
jgi:hypothetical protein